MPSDRFTFAGFAPNADGPRKRFLEGLGDAAGTVVLYESPRRVGKLLAAAAQTLGAEREAALCRELTKKFEEVRRGPLSLLARGAQNDPPRGEVVLVIDRGQGSDGPVDIEAALREALQRMSLRDATAHVSALSGRPRREVYQLALRLSEDGR